MALGDEPLGDKPVGEGIKQDPWFIVPYKRRLTDPDPTRYCAMDDFTAQIKADGGGWSETEILGDRALVKVRASVSTIAQLAMVFTQLPGAGLTNNFSGLLTQEKTDLNSELLLMGYSQAEIDTVLGSDLTNKTLEEFLQFSATRRKKPRYDAQTDTIICDGPDQTCKPVLTVEQEIS